MLTVKKQLTALGLLLLVALPLFFSAFTFFKKQLIEYQREARFKTELQETITLDAAKVNWVEAGKEIEISGNLFDVETYKITGSKIVLTGFYDYKEEQLVKRLNILEQEKTKAGSPLNKVAVKFLFLPNYKEITSFSIQNNWHIVANRFPVYSESISCIVYTAVAPPPKYC
jgi:hypothetical protein